MNQVCDGRHPDRQADGDREQRESHPDGERAALPRDASDTDPSLTASTNACQTGARAGQDDFRRVEDHDGQLPDRDEGDQADESREDAFRSLF